jgi:hypothetical protein
MTGTEYLTGAALSDRWRRIDAALDAELAAPTLPLQAFLRNRNASWNLVGRVHFNLTENRKDEEAPFALPATHARSACWRC